MEKEEEEVSEELGQIAQNVANRVVNNQVDISSFHPIFQELIKVQSGKANGVKYHPM